MRRRALAALTLVVGLLLAGGAAADDRTLYWRALDVHAHLDRDGRLHVRERHTMVFNGAWNGGERRFRLGHGQHLKFERLSRIDPVTGAAHPLRSGKLSAVDQYQWATTNTLRWRSRLPSDPPFQKTERVYEIEYVLSNILVPRDSTYILDHDFAFPDRQWPIRRFSLDLKWDPAWQVGRAFSGELVRENLRPGESVVLTLPFRYAAAGAPAGVKLPAAPVWRNFLIIAFLGFVAWRAALFYRHEKRLGRYAPLVPLPQIDDVWLEQNVFTLPPETVGATWDKTTAAAEVAAVLARMTAEGKLKSEVQSARVWLWRRDVLHLKLLRARNELGGYERKLVDALFFEGDATDTARIREHYRKSGFDPAKKIGAALSQRLQSEGAGQLAHPSRQLTLVLFLSAIALVGVGLVQDPDAAPVSGIAALIAIGIYIFSRVWALNYDHRVVHVLWHGAHTLALLLALAAALGYVVITEEFILGPWILAGLTLLGAAIFNSQFNAMRSRDTLAFTLLRKNLASARRYFEKELHTQGPRLKDAWLPYLLAFGLGPRVDRWFRSYGDHAGGGSGYGANSGAVSRSGGWSGGGGSFGGGGATGSWAAAVSGVAAGVAAASSGGGGGGGSSGGGGGGGW